MEPDAEQNKKTGPIKVLKKWLFHENFPIRTDGQGQITSLVWKDCLDKMAHIRNEATLRGEIGISKSGQLCRCRKTY